MGQQEQLKIGLITSGGDAPGMNAAIRAVVRTAVFHGIKVYGFKRGYEGLIHTDIMEMNNKSVSDIIYRGGTMLLTARCAEMMTPEGQEKAANVCKILNLDALIVIGGDGSLHGGLALTERGVNVIGLAGTIDLDLPCTDYTIGFDTAVNTVMDAITKIRDTSTSHERCSVVEVMGRNAGYIALWCGISGGAEEVLVPEDLTVDETSVIEQIIKNRSSGKNHNLIIVAEGRGSKGKTEEFAKTIEKATGIETRATILGHLQRGGSPTAVDRMHAAMMGHKAVETILKGERNKMVIYKNAKYEAIDLAEALAAKREYDPSYYEIMKILSV
ncbi:MAG: 6-phosphofructokinase [Clostridiales bacterium]|jgi:6-phosphofructokinase 1|nr:6-phosphofructokinase [Clostridiales bacterium]